MNVDGGILNQASNELTDQQVGLRFSDMQIPANAGILSAIVQFQAAGESEDLTYIRLTAQNSDNPEAFEAADHDISTRPRIAASVDWFPPAWSSAKSSTQEQQSPDLSKLVQKIVTRDNWVAGNSIAILMESDGERLIEAFEGHSDGSAELIVTYTTLNAAPVVDSGVDQTIVDSKSTVLNGNVFDDGLPAARGYVDVRWTVASGPGSVIFSDPTRLATNAIFNSTGTYQLLLTATDGQLTAYDEVTINVGPFDH